MKMKMNQMMQMKMKMECEARTGEVTQYIADISKAKRHLQYNPQHSFEKGPEKAVEWYLKHT